MAAMKRKIPLDRDLLYELFHRDGLSIDDIALKFGASPLSVKSTFEKLGISRRRENNISFETLYGLYANDGLSVSKIAEKLDVTIWTVRLAMKKLKISASNKKIPRDRDLLYKMYAGEGMTAKEIGRLYDSTQQSVLNALRDVGIPVKKKGYDPIYKKYTDWDDENIMQILYGSLLGDGGLFRVGRNKNTIQFLEGHSIKQKEYLKWKNRYFKFNYYEMQPKDYGDKYAVPTTGNKSSSLSSMCHPFLDKTYDELYHIVDGKYDKNVEAMLDKIDDFGLLVWYFDDGSSRFGPIGMFFHTESFTHDEHIIMQKWFEDKYGVKPAISRFNNYGHDKTRENWQEKLTFYGDRARTLMEILKKQFVKHDLPMSMAYKVCPCWKYKRN